MSNVVSGLIKLFFGTKSEKDRKLIQPYVDKIKAIYPSIEQLTNDELRARSLALRNSVAEYISGEEKQIEELKAQLEDLDTSLNDKESISRRIDDLTEEIDRKIDRLMEALSQGNAPAMCYINRTVQKLEVQRQKLLAQQAGLPGKPGPQLNRLTFSSLDLEGKKRVAAQFIREIRLNNNQAEVYWNV